MSALETGRLGTLQVSTTVVLQSSAYLAFEVEMVGVDADLALCRILCCDLEIVRTICWFVLGPKSKLSWRSLHLLQDKQTG